MKYQKVILSIIGRLGSEGSAISHLDMRLKKNFDSLELEAGGQPLCHIKKGRLSFHDLNSVEVFLNMICIYIFPTMYIYLCY